MRKLSYYIASTVDGCIAAPDGAADFFPWDGDHNAVMTAEYPETLPTHVAAAVGLPTPEPRHFDTVVMGRGTYDVVLEEGFPSPYAHLRQYVFSTGLERQHPDVEIVSGDPVAKVRELKAQEGKGIWLCGGGNLAGVLREEIDELLVKIYPIVAGAGIRLFDGEFRATGFRLAAHRVFDSGMVFMTYRRL
ncbi:dihydrofolate reductase family protein [Allokutzneria sp. A3M-2-11 16]|uniref:dihydrofolate reductase family protein n=1 Tax=Allokutzneria sp. A3M-2-11 16 TaxID=2962043 RepID=UPI0020B7841D|nr:dihydrofolate reductase family protein [Allokutzneria sp. A3M-2-11 16]MCP3798776.1 dihydrofolate reductase family protein [Allokutzneria sp. A3M-2-11 16]